MGRQCADAASGRACDLLGGDGDDGDDRDRVAARDGGGGLNHVFVIPAVSTPFQPFAERDGVVPFLVPRRTEQGYRSRRSEEHTSELQSLMRISYAVFCLKKKKKQ